MFQIPTLKKVNVTLILFPVLRIMLPRLGIFIYWNMLYYNNIIKSTIYGKNQINTSE